MKVHGVAVAYLRNGGNYLLMKRADDRKHYPGVWDGVGGGIEAGEHLEPEKAVLREVFEETGINSDKITGLELKYIHTGMAGGMICYHYMFFGETTAEVFTQCVEGTLCWIPTGKFLDREFSPAIGTILAHYFTTGINTGDIYTCSEPANSGEIFPVRVSR